jgi:cytochrome c oxidase subunit 2
MKNLMSLVVVAPGLAMILTGGYLIADSPNTRANSTIDVVASAATFTFSPSAISVPVNKPTTLHLTSRAGTHSIQSDDLGIKSTTIEEGKFVDATFVPTKTGTFVVQCGTYCGVGHPNMKLTVTVVER